MEWGRIKSFLWGGVLGGFLGLVFAPRRRRNGLNPSFLEPEKAHPFSEAPCYREDDQFT